MPFIPDGATPSFKPDAPTSSFRPDQKQDQEGQGRSALDIAGGIASKINAYRGGLMKGATLGNFSPGELVHSSRTAMEENPGATHIGQAVGGAAAGAGIGEAASALAPARGIGAVLGQTVAGAAQGGLAKPQEGETRLGNAGIGALISGTLSAATEGVGALGKYVGGKLARFTKPQANAYLDRPEQVSGMVDMMENGKATPELQDEAADAINNSRKALKARGLGNASKLRELLSGKEIEVNPKDYLGIDQETDNLIMNKIKDAVGEQAGASPHLNMPDSVRLEGNEANVLKQKLQGLSSYKPGTVLDPVQAAKNEAMAGKASSLRQALENVGGDDVKALNQEMQEGTLVAKDLRQGLKKPLAYVSSQSPDRVATLGRAEDQGAKGLLDFGDSLGAAKKIVEPDHGSGIPTFTGKLAGRALLRGSNAAQELGKNSGALYQLLNQLRAK